jgi:hypothetical protein
MEPVTRLLQLPAQLHVVVKLAIEDEDGVAVIAGHGLIALLQVDDFKTNGSQRHIARFPHALLIGAAVNQRSSDLPDPIWIRAFFEMCEPSYPAHVSIIPASPPKLKKANLLTRIG